MDKGVGANSWSPIFKELIKLTPPNTIVNFELLWRDPQPQWASPGSRVVQIGDSAHSYLPVSSLPMIPRHSRPADASIRYV